MNVSPENDLSFRAAAGPKRVWQSLWFLSAVLGLLWVALALISAAQVMAWREIPWRTALGFAFMDWGPWILLSPVVLWYAQRIQIDGKNWPWTLPLHVLGALVIAFTAESTADLARRYELIYIPPPPSLAMKAERRAGDAGAVSPGPPGGARDFRRSRISARFSRARFSIPIYCVLVASAHAVAYHGRSLERERRALSAEARLSEARLRALQAQLNPHFLFNTLNAVSSLIYVRPEAADEMVCSLSDLLRRALALADDQEVTVDDELRFTEKYLNIQQLRFGERLSVQREIDSSLGAALLPTLILQPLVENAVIHGIATCAGPGKLQLTLARADQELVITVSNTGNRNHLEGDDETVVSVKEGIGLQNTRARLAALYGNTAHFTLTHNREGGMRAKIVLPLRFNLRDA